MHACMILLSNRLSALVAPVSLSKCCSDDASIKSHPRTTASSTNLPAACSGVSIAALMTEDIVEMIMLVLA